MGSQHQEAEGFKVMISPAESAGLRYEVVWWCVIGRCGLWCGAMSSEV